MASFHKWSIGAQVRWILGLLALMTAAGSFGLAFFAHRASQNAVNVYRDRLQPIQELMVVNEAYTVDITSAMRSVRGRHLPPEKGLEILASGQARAAQAWAMYRRHCRPTPDVLAVEDSLHRLEGLGLSLAALLPHGPSPELGIFGDEEWMPQVVDLTRHLRVLRDEEDRRAQELIQDLESRSQRTIALGLCLSVAILGCILFFGRMFSMRLRESVRSLVDNLHRVADGNLAPVPCDATGQGELAVAERELDRTVKRLRELMTTLQTQQDRLRASETRYRQLAERLPDVVYQNQMWPDGKRTWPFVSPQFEAFYGAPVTVLEKDPGYSLRKVHPEDQERFRQCLAEATARMGPMVWEGRSFTERSGELKWIRVRRTPTAQPDGSVLWDGVLEDITKLKQSEEALRLSEARATEASRAKSAFLASMSHELRTPLSAILGYTRLMAREPGRSEGDRVQMNQVVRAGEHLLALINDVLSLSKIEAGRMELQPCVFSPGELVREMESLFRLSAQSKGLHFEVDAPNLPAQVEGDQPKLRQVLVNLLGNALKFTQVGIVRLSVSWNGDVGRFRVEDTGPGIAPEDQVTIFAAFHQANLGQAASGTGLGLHISQSLVELLGGTLRLESAVGRGSRFMFEIPLPEPEFPMLLPAAGQVVSLAPGGPQRTLLVVDDRPENRDILDRMLTQVGFRCVLAEDGEEALDRWRETRPDLVLMDLRMPRLDGFRSVARLRALEAAEGLVRTPVIAISASVYDVTTEDLVRQGFDAFLIKPIDENLLFTHLEELLDLRFERLEPEAPAGSLAGLEALAAQDKAWQARFLDLVASGDLETAETLLKDLPESALAEVVRRALRAYNLDEILKYLR